MRDLKVTDENYFTHFNEQKNEIIEHLLTEIKSGIILEKNLPRTRNLIFIKSLERLIAQYSNGESLDVLKSEYTSTLNSLKNGWSDFIVKFKKGRPQVIHDKYMLNEYTYMIWMLSLAILLRVSKKELNILKFIIEKGNIDDELILFLLQMNTAKASETTYKPFKSLLKTDILKTDSNQIKKYLDKWYQNTRLLTWHNYNPEGEKYFYYGRWSFESAVVVAILDLDDSKFRDNEYYPKDLVDYYRAKPSLAQMT